MCGVFTFLSLKPDGSTGVYGPYMEREELHHFQLVVHLFTGKVSWVVSACIYYAT